MTVLFVFIIDQMIIYLIYSDKIDSAASSGGKRS